MAASEERSLYELRQQERADGDRNRERWHAASPGYSETETVYVIEYRRDGDPTWFGCSPFFEPVSLRPEETHSRQEAEEAAVLLMRGERRLNKQDAPRNLDAVRIIERIATARIVTQISAGDDINEAAQRETAYKRANGLIP